MKAIAYRWKEGKLAVQTLNVRWKDEETRKRDKEVIIDSEANGRLKTIALE